MINEIQIGDCYIIDHLFAKDPVTRRKMLNFGFIEGNTFSVIMIVGLLKPYKYVVQLNGSRYAISTPELEQLSIRKVTC